jgi:hypothetical protein
MHMAWLFCLIGSEGGYSFSIVGAWLMHTKRCLIATLVPNAELVLLAISSSRSAAPGDAARQEKFL